MSRKVRALALFVCALLLAAAALPHALGAWPGLQARLVQGGADADLIGALRSGWYFGSLAMLGFAAIVAHAGVQAWHGERPALPPLLTITSLYTGYGLAAYLLRGHNAHYFGFVGSGLLLGVVSLWKIGDREN